MTIPPVIPCKLDFREGCYQINFKPTASLVTFEGTLRVDRSAPDGGADHLIVSGDLYTRLPVIGPIAPYARRHRLTWTKRGEPIAAMSMSVAGALSAVDAAIVPHPILKPTIPIFARARYHSYLKVTSVSAPVLVPSPSKCSAHDRRRAVQLHAAAGRAVQGHISRMRRRAR